jgi:hypothetical protein
MKWILYKGQVHTHVSIYNFTYKQFALKVHGNLHKKVEEQMQNHIKFKWDMDFKL